MAEGVTVGNAGKIAAELVSVALTSGQDLNNVVGAYTSTLEAVVAALETHQTPQQPPVAPIGPPAQGNVTGVPPVVGQAFPGTTVIDQGQPGNQNLAPVIPHPTMTQPMQVPNQPTAPAPIPGVAPVTGNDPNEQIWQLFFQDMDSGQFDANWESMAPVKQSGKMKATGPDFKHRSWKEPGEKYTVSVWLDGKEVPAWAQQRLRQIGWLQ